MYKEKWALRFYEGLKGLIEEKFPKENAFAQENDPLLRESLLHDLINNAPGIVCVYNFKTTQYVFFSENAKDIVGYDAADFLNGGLEFGMSTFHENHAKVYSEKILPRMIEYIQLYAQSHALEDIQFSHCFKVRKKDQTYKWFMQKMNFVEVDELGYPILSVIIMVDVDDIKLDPFLTFTVRKKTQAGIMEEIFSERYVEDSRVDLTNRELEILALIGEGKSSSEISDALFISLHTVNTHRKNMLKKLDAKNAVELLKYAENFKSRPRIRNTPLN